jgi:Flp pilus assembly protein TadD
VIFQQAGRGDLALVLYKKVLELKPNDEDTLQNMKILGQAH